MLHRKVICLLVVAFLFPIISCTRISEAPSPNAVQFGIEKLPALDSIPSDWGKLVSVNTAPNYQNFFQLWFQDENGKIRVAAYDIKNRHLYPDALVIPRK
jgi:hypothetical protein